MEALATTKRESATVERLPEPNRGDFAISARGIRKRYGKGESYTDALLGIDLQVRHGEVLGVLGPNGAGKTTLIEILEGLRTADAGAAQVLGTQVTGLKSLKPVRHRIGVSMQHTVLPPLLTVQELLNLHTVLYENHRDADKLISDIGLSDKRNARFQHLSGGQQQRVAIALAMIGDPELVFLDEPTSQLDPQARRAVWDLIENQRERRNAAILITTHQMEEAQRICDRVVILDHGKILAEGAPLALVSEYCPERVIDFVTPEETDFGFLGERIVERTVNARRAKVRMRAESVSDMVVELMTRQSRGEMVIDDFRIERQTLEDVFLKLTGRRIRD